MKLIWQDASSYSRGGDRTPTCWQTRTADGLRITVYTGHAAYPGAWLLSCHQLGIEDEVLGPITAEEAQEAGVRFVKNTLERYLRGLP